MANMVLGSYTFAWDPSDMSIIQKDRAISYARTHDAVATFSWGTAYIGNMLELSWAAMTTSQYESLLTLLTNDTAIVFDPQDGKGFTFNVEIISLEGKYFINTPDAAGNYRTEVSMQLLILSQV